MPEKTRLSTDEIDMELHRLGGLIEALDVIFYTEIAEALTSRQKKMMHGLIDTISGSAGLAVSHCDTLSRRMMRGAGDV